MVIIGPSITRSVIAYAMQPSTKKHVTVAEKSLLHLIALIKVPFVGAIIDTAGRQ